MSDIYNQKPIHQKPLPKIYVDPFVLSIEGIDGSGKSSLLHGLKDENGKLLAPGLLEKLNIFLSKTGQTISLLKETADENDYADDFTKQKTKDLKFPKTPQTPEQQNYIFMELRNHHIETLKNNSQNHNFTIYDRNIDSTIAYQNNIVRGKSAQKRQQLRELALKASDGIVPSLTIFLKADIAQVMERKKQREQSGTTKKDEIETTFENAWDDVQNSFLEEFKNPDNINRHFLILKSNNNFNDNVNIAFEWIKTNWLENKLVKNSEKSRNR